ncbi:hypothetical protein HF313_30720 [Massilia atriviolacea]|uniref:Uncharacterized protein n=1 Tax=Massilia atriviolacea TaxID=2495579 RepID=A0A430HC72_9BURK|nr:hypothetical protein [Massilia atriviolacea]RSZ55115.1 hypothetical protein EJB06_31170 [Massilia atriviolacea]
MSTSSIEAYPQDDLSVLAPPAGTEHLVALRPEPLPAVVVAAAAPEAPAAAPVKTGPEPAGGVLKVVVGATVAGCAAAGLFAWFS